MYEFDPRSHVSTTLKFRPHEWHEPQTSWFEWNSAFKPKLQWLRSSYLTEVVASVREHNSDESYHSQLGFWSF